MKNFTSDGLIIQAMPMIGFAVSAAEHETMVARLRAVIEANARDALRLAALEAARLECSDSCRPMEWLVDCQAEDDETFYAFADRLIGEEKHAK